MSQSITYKKMIDLRIAEEAALMTCNTKSNNFKSSLLNFVFCAQKTTM